MRSATRIRMRSTSGTAWSSSRRVPASSSRSAQCESFAIQSWFAERAHGGTAEIGRNILGTNLAPRRGDSQAAAGVHQLAHVARPIEGDERALRRGREQFGLDAELLSRDAQVVMQELRNVLAPIAQRRNLDADHIQPMQQVLAEVPRLHARLEILVGRRDHPHIDSHRRLTAHSIELTLREHAQEPGLQRRGHVADLVEKQGAAVGLLEASSPERSPRR